MAKVSETYAGVYLNASELTPLGQRRIAVVHAVTMETVGQENRQVLVLDLVAPSGRAWPKRVVLNKGNALQMATAFGDDADHWPGNRIEIWAENVMFQGRLVPGVKVLPAPDGNGAAPPPTMPATRGSGGPQWGGPGSDLDDEIPF
jgi:hypothetical protein